VIYSIARDKDVPNFNCINATLHEYAPVSLVLDDNCEGLASNDSVAPC
jgi:hypothetical protein